MGWGVESPIEHRWDLFEDAPTLVKQRFDDMKLMGNTGYAEAMAAITALQAIAEGLALINQAIAIDTTTIEGSLPNRPEPTINESDYDFKTDTTPPQKPTGLIDATLDPFPENWPDLIGPGEVDVGPLVYTSDILVKLQNKILADLTNGSTGISPEVEDAIFKRNYERDLTEYDDEQDRIAANWGRGGFPYPNGGLRAALDKATRDFGNKRTDVSRDVMFKSWQYAFENTHFIITQGLAVESMLIKWAESVATRIFEASKAVIDKNLRTYETQTKGIVEKVRYIIEKGKAKIEYNLGLIRQYEAEVTAYAASMRAESDRINAVARGDEAEVNVFRSLVDFDTRKVELNLKVIQAKIDQAVANAHILIKDKEVDIKHFEALNGLKAEAQKAIGSIAAQVAAGALSAVHAQVSIGSSDDASYYYNPNQVPTEE